ncbi:MAG: tetratricopeptide repeat protein [Paludibacteraceae bacterium]|nr:tetratricopeptide repeat protein [Paludibacteraceae bacterium]
MKSISNIRYIIASCFLCVCMAVNAQSYQSRLAMEKLQQNDMEGAIAAALKGIELNKKDGQCHYLLGYLYSHTGQFEQALEECAAGIRLLPKEKHKQAQMYSWMGQILSIAEMYDQALAYVDNALKLEPEETDWYSIKAGIYMKSKQYDEARQTYAQLFKIYPGQRAAHDDLGTMALEENKLDEAQYHVDYAFGLGSDFPETYQLQTKIHLRKGEYDKAVSSYLQSIEEGGEDAMDIPLLDSLLEKSPEYTTIGLELMKKARPGTITWPYLQCQAAGWMNNKLKASDYMQELIDENQSVSFFYLYQAQLYRDLNQFDKALEMIQKALDLDSTNADAFIYEVYSDIYLVMDSIEPAMIQIRKALAINPQNASYYRGLARLYAMKDDYTHAAALMDTALLLSDEILIKLNAGEYKLRLGNKEEGERLLREVVEYTIKDDENDRHSTKAYAYASLNDKESALKELGLIEPQRFNQGRREYEYAQIYSMLGEPDSAVFHLRQSFQHNHFAPVGARYAYRFRPIAQDSRFIALADSIDIQVAAEVAAHEQAKKNKTDQQVVEFPFTRKNGVTEVKCSINGLQLYFIFDTGAADVSISSVEANYMLRNGYLTAQDIQGKQNFVNATGDISEGTIINLREVNVGGIVLHDIKASVVHTQNAPLLLGQSVFQRLGRIEIDNEKQVLRLTYTKN